MTRQIHTHEINPCNSHITVEAQDGPGPGNASHKYIIKTPEQVFGNETAPGYGVNLRFQNGPVNEDGNGINGITNESLLAIVIDRLQGFQSGEYKCRENALALTKIEEALHWLHHRTRERMARGVEGTHQK